MHERRHQLITEARTWIGTPWRHQGRLKGVACDCVGVIICVPRALGIVAADFDINGYSRFPDPQVMARALDQHLDRIAVGDAIGGDILWVSPRRIAHHLQLLTFDNTVIHAMDAERGVREHRFDRQRYPVAAAFRYRGIDG